MSDDGSVISRRNALKCMAYGGAGTLFALSGGVFTPINLAMAADNKYGAAKFGRPLFVGCTSKGAASAIAAARAVQVTRVQMAVLDNTLRAVGLLTPKDEARLS